MFENMSKREKIMASAVGAMAGIFVLFYGWNSISTGLQQRDDSILDLQSELSRMETVVRKGRAAGKRLMGYRQVSLPSKLDYSVTQYRLWLEELLNEIGISAIVAIPNPNTPRPVTGSDPRKPIYGSFSVNITQGECTLDQLVQFLHRFNNTKILHRCRDLTISPVTQGTGRRQVPTERLRVTMKVDLLCMSTAAEARKFEDSVIDNPIRTLAAYQDVVSRRDLFGLPNNPPEISTESSHEFDLGDDISIAIDVDEPDDDQVSISMAPVKARLANDADSFNPETVELLDGEVRLGELPEGNFEFVVTVKDSGWGNLEDEKKIRVSVVRPEEEPAPVEEEARPEAMDTYLASKIRVNGVAKVVIDIRPQGKRVELAVGEAMELDEKTWTITSFDGRKVHFRVDDQDLIFEMGSFLSNPID